MDDKKVKDVQIEINVDTTQIDLAQEKASRLVELLKEARQIINSLGGTTNISFDCPELSSQQIRQSLDRQKLATTVG